MVGIVKIFMPVNKEVSKIKQTTAVTQITFGE